MVTKQKQSNIYSKLTPFEKEALLYAILQQDDPSAAIKKMLASSHEPSVKWDGYKRLIKPALRNILTKLGENGKVEASWITPQTCLSNVEDIFIELDLLCKNESISARAKAVGALIIFEIFIDDNLRFNSEAQKNLIHKHSLLKTDSIFDLFGELKSTTTKALKELGEHPIGHYSNFSYTNELKNKFVKSDSDWDTDLADSILNMLRLSDISWLAKGVLLFHLLYEIHPTTVACFCNRSNTDSAYSELDRKLHLTSKEAQ